MPETGPSEHSRVAQRRALPNLMGEAAGSNPAPGAFAGVAQSRRGRSPRCGRAPRLKRGDVRPSRTSGISSPPWCKVARPGGSLARRREDAGSEPPEGASFGEWCTQHTPVRGRRWVRVPPWPPVIVRSRLVGADEKYQTVTCPKSSQRRQPGARDSTDQNAGTEGTVSPPTFTGAWCMRHNRDKPPRRFLGRVGSNPAAPPFGLVAQ